MHQPYNHGIAFFHLKLNTVEDATVPFVGMIRTVAALGAGLLVAIRRESEE